MRSRLIYLGAFALVAIALVVAAASSKKTVKEASVPTLASPPSKTTEAAPAMRRHLFTRTPLYSRSGNSMRATTRSINEQTLEVISVLSNIGGYDWLRVVNRSQGIDGWIMEHLTSAVPDIVIPKNGLLPIGQERVDRFEALPPNYRPADLVKLDWQYCKIRQIEMRREAAQAFIQLHKAAKKVGLSIYGFSGFRPYETQRQLYLNRITIGERHRQRYVARPGHTEHQLGTVVDVVGPALQHAAMHSFDNTPEARWLRTHCYEFGFVLSYGPDIRIPTGYGYESWHIRYLGSAAIPGWVRRYLDPKHEVARKYAAKKS
jgi:hypothetical protein